MTPLPISTPVPGMYGETQDLSANDVARLFSALLEDQDPEDVEDAFAEYLAGDLDLE